MLFVPQKLSVQAERILSKHRDQSGGGTLRSVSIRLARSGNKAKAGTLSSLKAERELKLRAFQKCFVAKHGLAGTIRHEPPLVQHQHAIAAVVDKSRSWEARRRAEGEMAEYIQKIPPILRIQRGRGLIEKQKLRREGKYPGNAASFF